MKPNIPITRQDKSVIKMTLHDAWDDYISWLVLWLFLSSINLAMEASAYLLSEEVGRQVHAWAQLPSRAGGVVILISIFVFARRRQRAGWKPGDRVFLDGYTMEVVKRSALVSFFVTLPLVVLLDVVTNHTMLPADFFIKLPAFSLAASFSICFFFWSRSVPEEPE